MSKTRDVRNWKKWYASGAIKQPPLPTTGLVIDAVGSHFSGRCVGLSTLSLSRPQDRNTGVSYSPVLYVIVPTSERLVIGKKLDRLPGNAAPIDLFFPKNEAMSTSTKSATRESDFLLHATKTPAKVEFRHGTYARKYTAIDKEGGWSQDEVNLFVSCGVECENWAKHPNRVVVATTVEIDEIEALLGHTNFTSKHVDRDRRWE